MGHLNIDALKDSGGSIAGGAAAGYGGVIAGETSLAAEYGVASAIPVIGAGVAALEILYGGAIGIQAVVDALSPKPTARFEKVPGWNQDPFSPEGKYTDFDGGAQTFVRGAPGDYRVCHVPAGFPMCDPLAQDDQGKIPPSPEIMKLLVTAPAVIFVQSHPDLPHQMTADDLNYYAPFAVITPQDLHAALLNAYGAQPLSFFRSNGQAYAPSVATDIYATTGVGHSFLDAITHPERYTPDNVSDTGPATEEASSSLLPIVGVASALAAGLYLWLRTRR